MRYLSVCSGIESASVAWHPLGWTPVAFSEIEPFPCAVLAHRFPHVPNHGDMTKFKEWPDAAVDVLVGGTPCQSFSVAGLRKGLADPRGNLTLTYLAMVARYRPRWVVWENVPGVLSDSTGAFAALLGGMAQLGYWWAYRVLDAQFFGVPQRRRRVFVVGHLGDWRRAAAVFSERESLLWNPPPRRTAGEGFTPPLSPSLTGSGRGTARVGESRGQDCVIAHALRGVGFDASEDGTGRGTPLVAAPLTRRPYGDNEGRESTLVAFDTTQITSAANRCNPKAGDPCHPLAAGAHAPAIAYQCQGSNVCEMGTLRAGNGNESGGVPFIPIDMRQASRGDKLTNNRSSGSGGPPGHGVGDAGDPAFTVSERGQAIAGSSGVRRLTPRECERLQGFPDDWTLVPYRGKPASDGPRYAAIGNSMAVPVMRWIGRRIQTVDAL